MEKEKRKRGEKESKEGLVMEKKQHKKVRKEEEVSEKEVEEFFAILRRMKAVVKYFEKGAAGEGWRAAVEAERPVVEDNDDDDAVKDDIDNDKTGEAVEENGVFDLNAAPDEEEDPIS
ncbi:hypothetical protein DITRI_Ditri04bG0195700 [Diplodiscus trichospermus]